MFTSDLAAPVIEPIATRYDRDQKHIKDDRKVRNLDYESDERRSRRYVNPATIVVDEDGTVHGTVVVRHDTEPAGFDRNAFEDDLVYDPNA